MSNKYMKNLNVKKSGQALVEFVLIALLVGAVSFWVLLKLNPDFFRSYLRGSLSSSTQIDSNGQLALGDYDETSNAVPPPAPAPAPLPAGCALIAIGAVETDGTILAGFYGGNRLCITPAADTVILTWNDGSAPSGLTGAASLINGQANTALLAALTDPPLGNAPYKAAQYCDTLNKYGHNDWYLPSRNELLAIYPNKIAIGGFVFHDHNTSSESNASKNWVVQFNDGSINSEDKNRNDHYVRCIRHD